MISMDPLTRHAQHNVRPAEDFNLAHDTANFVYFASLTDTL